MLKKLQKNWKDNDNEVDDDVAQLECNNNKCYVSTFRYIQIALKFGICLYNVKKYAQQYIENINKNIFNYLLITAPRRTCTLLFQKFPTPAPTPASRNTTMLHSVECYSLHNEYRI